MGQSPEAAKFPQWLSSIIDPEIETRKWRFGPDTNGARLTPSLVSSSLPSASIATIGRSSKSSAEDAK